MRISRFVLLIGAIFGVFYVSYGLEYGWLTPLWFFPLMLLVILAAWVIGAALGRR